MIIDGGVAILTFNTECEEAARLLQIFDSLKTNEEKKSFFSANMDIKYNHTYTCSNIEFLFREIRNNFNLSKLDQDRINDVIYSEKYNARGNISFGDYMKKMTGYSINELI